MKTYSSAEFANSNLNIIFINVLQQFWRNTKTFSCIGKPKEQNLLLLINGCKITYKDKNGKTFTAKNGDVIYVPKGIEYTAHLSDFETDLSHTIGINFLLLESSGEDVILSDEIKVFPNYAKSTEILFLKLLKFDSFEPLMRKRILLSEILCSLMCEIPSENIPEKISSVIEYLSEHIEENPPISHLAEISNVSEVYFRKQFKAYTGVSPVKYRNTLRLNKARTHLEFGDISIQEISDMLGYSTVSHFIKEFKGHTAYLPINTSLKTRMVLFDYAVNLIKNKVVTFV